MRSPPRSAAATRGSFFRLAFRSRWVAPTGAALVSLSLFPHLSGVLRGFDGVFQIALVGFALGPFWPGPAGRAGIPLARRAAISRRRECPAAFRSRFQQVGGIVDAAGVAMISAFRRSASFGRRVDMRELIFQFLDAVRGEARIQRDARPRSARFADFVGFCFRQVLFLLLRCVDRAGEKQRSGRKQPTGLLAR